LRGDFGSPLVLEKSKWREEEISDEKKKIVYQKKKRSELSVLGDPKRVNCFGRKETPSRRGSAQHLKSPQSRARRVWARFTRGTETKKNGSRRKIFKRKSAYKDASLENSYFIRVKGRKKAKQVKKGSICVAPRGRVPNNSPSKDLKDGQGSGEKNGRNRIRPSTSQSCSATA